MKSSTPIAVGKCLATSMCLQDRNVLFEMLAQCADAARNCLNWQVEKQLFVLAWLKVHLAVRLGAWGASSAN